MGSKAVKVVLVALAVLLLIWVASEIIIPPVAASIVKREITKRSPQAQDVKVSISAFPAIKLIFKQYSNLHVSGRNLTLQGNNFESLDLLSTHWPDGTYVAVISQDELNHSFKAGDTRITNTRIELLPGVARVTGQFNDGSFSASFTANGVLRTDGKAVFYVPTEVRLAGVLQPESIVSMVRTVLEEFPSYTTPENGSIRVDKVTIEQGKLSIAGDVNLETALDVHL